MDRSRRRRQFNRELEDEKNYRERFRFPLDMDDEKNENDKSYREESMEDADKSASFIRREQRKTLFEETKKTEKKESSFRISKAREIPSAVHGTKKHITPDGEEGRETSLKQKPLPGAAPVPSAIHGTNKKYLSEEELSYIEADKNEVQIANQGYTSPIIENLKKERILRAKKEQKRLEDRKRREAREKARYDDPYNLKGRQAADNPEQEAEVIESKETSAVSEEPKELKEIGAPKTSSPYNVIMTPYDKKKQLSSSKNEVKRQGPKYTMPSIHMLGSDLTADYGEADTSLAKQIIDAFDAVGIPAEVYDYKTNGVIGRYGISLDRTFRLSNIARLREHLAPNLPFDNFRIIAPIIGTSNIGVEFPLRDPIHIPFSKVFSSSSLKLRKNDLKFVVGKTVDDKIFSYELQKAGHMLIYGNNEIDSSNIIDNVLISLMMNHNPNELRVLIASDKAHYEDYKGLPHLFQPQKSIMDPDVLSGLFKELNDRHNQFRRAHVRNLNSYNQRVNYESRKSVITVVIDDLSQLFENNNPDAVRTIVQILKKGKPLGIHLIMKHTRPDVNIRFEWLQMMQTRISFKDEKANIIEGSETLVDGNDMLVQIPTSNKALRVNGAVLPDDSKQRVFSHLKNIGG